MRLAVTADLHFGHGGRGDAATMELARYVRDLQPDVFALGGDVGTGDDFTLCLELFRRAAPVLLVVPGNHDVWTDAPSPASLTLYEAGLPWRAAEAGFQYLDDRPYVDAAAGIALVGSMNWYDYSFADPELEREFPDARVMFARKLFPNARHNDGVYVKLGMSDGEFTTRLVERFQTQLAALPPEVSTVITLQHHPPVRALFYPTPLETPDQRFWAAYTGNRRMQDAVMQDPRIRWVLCGHTHAACDETVEGKRCLNIGGDYGWKRLLVIDTDTGEVEALEFGRR